MARVWWATVHGVAKSQTLLSARARTHTHTHTHTERRFGHLSVASVLGALQVLCVGSGLEVRTH